MPHTTLLMQNVKNRRIGFVSVMNVHPFGGSEYLWAQTAKRLLESGAMIGANVQWWPQLATQIQELEQAGCQLTFRREITRIHRIIKRILPLPEKHWLDTFRPDLVVLSLGIHGEGLDWMRECSQRNIRYAIIIQSVCETSWMPNYNEYAQAYANASACFFVSKANQEYVESQFAQELPHAKVVRNPYNVSFDTELPWPDTKNGYKLACIGRYEPSSKGQDILFAALRNEIWHERPITISLFGKGVYQENFQALAKMYNLKNIVIHNYAKDVEEIWATHHGLVLPSRYEGLPLVVVEAMLCGRFVIVTDVAGNAELLEDNVSGFVAKGANVRQLHEAMDLAWQRRNEWEQIGLEAKIRVKQLIPKDPISLFVEQVTDLLL